MLRNSDGGMELAEGAGIEPVYGLPYKNTRSPKLGILGVQYLLGLTSYLN